ARPRTSPGRSMDRHATRNARKPVANCSNKPRCEASIATHARRGRARRVAGMYVCEVCGAEADPLSEPGIVYAVELEIVHSRRGLEQLEGPGAYFHVPCYPEASNEWARKPMPTSVYDGGA